MFKELISILKKQDLVKQSLEDTNIMFDKSKQLFDEATNALAEERKPSFDIYALDREINGIEKKIRRKVLENLSINPKQDVVATLVLTSIIIDIERIGDYSKNIYELFNLCHADTKNSIDLKLMKDAGLISEKFKQTAKTLQIGDENEAIIIMEQLNNLKREFDHFILNSVKNSNASIRQAIVNVLLARYLKRVAAHLENIASSIANPFDMIGFYQDNPYKEAD